MTATKPAALDAALEVARAGRERWKADLVEELHIPSVSTLPEHHAECLRNAEWLKARFEALGFETSLVDVVPGGKPVLRADWMGRPGQPVLTMYGHYDVQPPDPLDEWQSPPFEPVERDGLVYARGCSDNKGNHMAALAAATAWFEAGGPPINLRFLIEGEEEIGGEALPVYLRREAADLATDYVVLWDGAFTIDDLPSLTVGLRGMLYVEVELHGATQDLHSGGFGGVAPNAAEALATLIASLHDEKRRVTVPGFYDAVRDPDPAERALWHVLPDEESRYLSIIGSGALVGEEGYGVVERVWSRPTLEVNGIVGGFTGEGMKTVIPASARAKLSMRLVPDQDPLKVFDALQRHLESAAPAGTRVTVRVLTQNAPLLMDPQSALVVAMRQAFKDAFGVEAGLQRSGGSIPVANAFAEALDTTMVASGVAQVSGGAHGPNEHLDLGIYQRGIETLVRLMALLARG